MFEGDVDRLVEAYKLINSAWEDSYADYIADDFRDTSDSINILTSIPLGSVTFATEAAYIAFQKNRVSDATPPLYLLSTQSLTQPTPLSSYPCPPVIALSLTICPLQRTNSPLVVTHSSPYSCTEIALIWQTTFGASDKPVRGIAVLGTEYNFDQLQWQIKSIDVEFNTLAYLLDIGGSYTLPGK
jgi:hypothetical protein